MKIVVRGQNSARADEAPDLTDQGEKCGEVYAAKGAKEEPPRSQTVRRSMRRSKEKTDRGGRRPVHNARNYIAKRNSAASHRSGQPAVRGLSRDSRSGFIGAGDGVIAAAATITRLTQDCYVTAEPYY